jgi:hypothetical protein
MTFCCCATDDVDLFSMCMLCFAADGADLTSMHNLMCKYKHALLVH